MANYYKEKLSAQNLFQVYDTQMQRIKQYLQAEIDFVKDNLLKSYNVLELGAGYGRIMKKLAPYCNSITGIDISEENIDLGKEYLKEYSNTKMVVMDVHKIHFTEPFHVILCLQNGLSAMGADAATIHEIMKMLAPGGTAYFSSYSTKFWDIRLKWFEEQASKGLLGEINYSQTGNGVIICKDGFKGITHTVEDFKKIGEELGYPYDIEEVDESSLFLIIHKQ